jgi:thiopurine S-methyltransferase
LNYGSKIIPSFESGDETCPNPIRIFVPLCGKTVDMAFLATHNSISEIVGIDGVRKALDEFAATHGSELDIVEVDDQNDGYERLTGKSITLLKGDFFELKDAHTGGKFDAVWDRASIVAIDPSMREAYVATMSLLVKPGGSLLVSTLDRRTGTEEAMKSGPPFSVPESELRRLYEGQDWVESVELLDEVDEFEANPDQKARFVSQGITSFYELLFLIKAKA